MKLTEANQEFIRKNYRSMSADQMANAIGRISKHGIADFKKREGLKKLNYQIGERKPVAKSKYFNVDAQYWL